LLKLSLQIRFLVALIATFYPLVFAPCGCPYNNAVAEAMFKVLKAEFANGAYFTSLEQLAFELEDYVTFSSTDHLIISLQ